MGWLGSWRHPYCWSILSPSAFVGVLALIAFHLVVGWKVYSLSRARREP
jgi:hypothetical protein